MRNDKLIPGTILVIIGALFLLDNFNVINFSWSNIFHLWPIILIIAGVNLVFAYNRSGAATAVKFGVLIVGVGFLVYGGLGHRHYGNNLNYNFNFDDNGNGDDDGDNDTDSTSITKVEGSGHYRETYKPAVKLARLNISGGGASYILKDTTNQLFEADTKEYKNKYVLTSSGDSTTQTLNFDMGNTHHHGVVLNLGDTRSNRAVLKLNNSPEWEINAEAGAARLNFDLTAFKVKKLKLEGGAASFSIKMGTPLTQTDVEVSTGISEVTLYVPRDAACSIITTTGLSSKSFDGFSSISGNEYQTPGFDKAVSKLYIKLSGGVSDFKVKRY